MHVQILVPFIVACLTLKAGVVDGTSSADKIIGGTYVNITKAPYMLSFMLNGRHACGAAIISKDWGLTAAHCATAYREDPYAEITIRSGSEKLGRDGVVHRITDLIWHERFNPDLTDHDIAVFKVDPPFKYNDATQPVNLPEGGYNCTPVRFAKACGWGYFLTYAPILSEQLECVTLPRVNRLVCRLDFLGEYIVTATQVCYGYRRGQSDTCKGDSGGPLVNKKNQVIGITSWGSGCGLPMSPGVYTDVVLLRDWVKNKTGV